MPAQAERTRSTYVPKEQGAQIKWLENLHASGLSYKERWSRDWPRAAEIYRGNNWDTKKEGNPFFKTNLARAKLDRKAAQMTASKPIFGVMPRRSGLTNTARYLQKMVDALWDSLSMQMRLEMLSAFVRPFGCGFFKTVWDPRARQGLGDIVVAEIDPRAIVPDPYTLRAYDLDRSLSIIHETSIPYSWITENFPDTADDIEDFNAPPPSQNDREEGGIRGASGPIRSPLRYYLGGMRGSGHPGSVSPVPYVRLREFWYVDPQTDEDVPVYPNGRVTYLAGSGNKATILNPDPEHAKNPFWDGMWPFDLYDNRGDIDHPYGCSEVEDIRRLEESINRAGHMGMRQLIKNVPFIIADAGALSAEAQKRLQDFGDVILAKMHGFEVRREPATNAIGDIINFVNMTKGLMDESIGLGGGGPVAGKGRVEVRSPDLLYGLQENDQPLINMQSRRLEACLERVGQKIISRAFQFYRKDRFIPYVNAEGVKVMEFEVNKLREEVRGIAIDSVASRLREEQENEDTDAKSKRQMFNGGLVRLAIEEALRGAWREFEFKIVPLSSLATTRAARAKVMSQFAEVGIMPFRMVLEEAGFSNGKDLMDESAAERKKMMELGLIQPPKPPGQKTKK